MNTKSEYRIDTKEFAQVACRPVLLLAHVGTAGARWCRFLDVAEWAIVLPSEVSPAVRGQPLLQARAADACCC